MSLAEYLKELRQNKAVPKKPTLEDVYNATKIPIASLSAMENGTVKTVDAVKLAALADYYGVPIKSLIDKIEA
jgi:cytoskeletal protein RodZ